MAYYKVVYDDFIDFQEEQQKTYNYWTERLSGLNTMFEKFMPESFQGQAADSINAYFSEVHRSIILGFCELMEISRRNYLMYKDEYYDLIDGHLHAVLPEFEFESIQERIRQCQMDLEDHHDELKKTINSVSHIVKIPVPNPENLYDSHEAVLKYVKELTENIVELEAKHKREDFEEFNALKEKLIKLMGEISAKGRTYKENYQLGDVAGLDSFADYADAIVAAESYLESTQERYEKAKEAEAIRIEQLAAEDRIKDGIIQIAWALVDVGAIVMTVVSGGTLAPISVAILTFSAGEIVEGAGNIYLGATGDGSSIAWNPVRDTIFFGNQDVYSIAQFGVNMADFGKDLLKPKTNTLNDILEYGAKVPGANDVSKFDELRDLFLKKFDDVKPSKAGKVGDDVAEQIAKTEKVFTDKPFNSNGDLKPNIKYQTGEFKYNYETDSYGRISNWNTDNLRLTDRQKRLSHKSNTPGKIDGDHAGHLAGDRFGGSPELDNLVSQSENVNLSQYRKIENQWANAIKQGKEVTVNVDIKYDGVGLRPTEFNIKYTIDGRIFKRNILN